jgi:hypothetical protein
MPKQGDVHVVPANGRWRVEIEGSARARSTHDTQSEAAKAAREIARKKKTELLIHSRNGQVRERNTYGSDPRRSRG